MTAGLAVCIERKDVSVNDLIFAAGGIGHYIFNTTVQNETQIIDRCGIQRFVFAQFINDSTGNVMFFDKRIGGFIRPFQCFPKWRINDHLSAPVLSI